MVRNAVSAKTPNRRVTTRCVPRISSGVIEPDEVAAGCTQAVYHYDGLNRRTLAESELASRCSACGASASPPAWRPMRVRAGSHPLNCRC